MTLPNITQREWVDDGCVIRYGQVGGVIATVHKTPEGEQTRDANAKAIAAVPELLEALTEVYTDCMSNMTVPLDLMGKVYKALIKAGCTEDEA